MLGRGLSLTSVRFCTKTAEKCSKSNLSREYVGPRQIAIRRPGPKTVQLQSES